MQRRSIDRRSLTAPGGFTLVEMLVATTLVVMMMLMFAEIYTAAIRSLNDQQALARNDQRMRAVDLVLRSDLLKCSFRQIPGARGIVPLVNGDTIHTMQKGYFYLSVNDRENPVDNVLQFTMLITPDNRVHDQTPFYGRCQGGKYPNTLVNHPDEDDGIPGNDVGMSRAAEVSYFVRGGNLYRRMLLLRDPQLDTVQYGPQPLSASGAAFVVAEAPQTTSFSQQYDYSAYSDPVGLHFLGLPHLDNYGTLGTPAVSLGRSAFRFGFSPTTGQPVEFAGSNFFGRMTHAETGHVNFQLLAANNPLTGAMTYSTTTNRLTAAGTELFNDTRVNEDLLMNNVEAFDIEVWDPTTDLFVQLGAATGATGFNAASRINNAYGPNATVANNWVFDTGHPGQFTAATVPYRPLLHAAPTFWSASTNYASSNVVFPTGSSGSIGYRCVRTAGDRNGNGILDTATEDTNGNNQLDSGEDLNNNGVLDLAESGTLAGTSSTSTPTWPIIPGIQIQDGTVMWESFDNRIGLEMIRITVRTRDTTTGNPRQFSIIHSFVEPPPAD